MRDQLISCYNIGTHSDPSDRHQQLRFLTNNLGMVKNSLSFLFTVGCLDIFTTLNIGDIQNDLIINKAFLMFRFFWLLMANLIFHVPAMWTLMLMVFNNSIIMSGDSSALDKCRGESKDEQFHYDSHR